MRCDVGIAERPQRLIIVLAGAGLDGFGVPYALAVALWVLVVLSAITVGQRMVQVHRQSRLLLPDPPVPTAASRVPRGRPGRPARRRVRRPGSGTSRELARAGGGRRLRRRLGRGQGAARAAGRGRLPGRRRPGRAPGRARGEPPAARTSAGSSRPPPRPS